MKSLFLEFPIFQFKRIVPRIFFASFLIFSIFISCQDKESKGGKNLSTGGEKDPKKLVVAMSLKIPPLQGIDPNGKPYGIFVDLVSDMADAFGQKLEIVTPNLGSAFAGLKTRQYDLLSFAVITPERRNIVDFSVPCGQISVSFMVKKDFPFVENVEQLNDPKVRIAVLKGSYPESIAFKQFPNAKIVSIPDLDSTIMEVVQGKSDVIIINPIVAHTIEKKHPDRVKAYYHPLSLRDISLAVNKTEDKEFLNKVNAFLTDYLESGKMQLLGDKYLGDLKKEFAKQGQPWDFVF